MSEDFCVRQISFQYEEELCHLKSFLDKHDLRYEADIETAFGLFTGDDVLVGCGCAAGALLKCFAVEEHLRGQNALGVLTSALTQDRFSHDRDDLFVITRAHNETLFTSCGFYPVVRTSVVSMLENRPDGARTFATQFWLPEDTGKTVGAIVMNCNPFTRGHRYLIQTATAQCDVLHIFVVEEDCSVFSAQDRLWMVEAGTADLTNVRVHLSGHYIISQATFPTYFLKQDESAAAIQSALDITLFAQHIAPALHITKRFAGQEPLDPITAQYNDAMRSLLPQYGIEFCEIPRLETDGQVISASWVRTLLQNGASGDELSKLLPETTLQYLINRK